LTPPQPSGQLPLTGNP